MSGILDLVSGSNPTSGNGLSGLTTTPVPISTPVGQTAPGNIDIRYRPVVHDLDSNGRPQVQTLYSESFHDNRTGKEVLVPRVLFVDLQGNPISAKDAKALYTRLGVAPRGKVVSPQEAWQFYLKTGDNMGSFDTPQNATKYSIWAHEQNAKQYGLP